jgi:hypothetical protein
MDGVIAALGLAQRKLAGIILNEHTPPAYLARAAPAALAHLPRIRALYLLFNRSKSSDTDRAALKEI